MGKVNAVISQFNRGIVSRLGLSRVSEADAASGRIRLMAEEQKNWMPRVLGSMMLRPGLEYILTQRNNKKAYHVPFVFSTTDTAIVEFTDLAMRVFVNETPVTRASVSTAVTNGTFDTDLSSWTDADETSCTSEWASGGYCSLTGTAFNSAIRRQEVTVVAADRDVQHALDIVVERGILNIKVGSSAGNDDYFGVALTEGRHSLAFTPTGNFHIEISANTKYATLVDSIDVASSGDMVITTEFAESDITNIRFDQSADVIFLAVKGKQNYKIERRGTNSWSLVKYLPSDGPFRAINVSKTTLVSDALSGDVTITASDNVFKSTNVGGLVRIESTGQTVEIDATGEGQWTNAIRVTGVDESRDITVTRAGTWSATITLQRSRDEGASWTSVATYTTNATITYNDTLDNQDLQYRIGIDTGDYTSGTATLTLTYSSGSITGIARIHTFNSATSVDAHVLSDFGGTTASEFWYEGEWSDRRGYPTAVALYEGRLAWGGKNKLQISESDAYNDFDDNVVGDAGPLNRSIAVGPADNISWLFSGSRLVMGTDGSEIVTRQAFDDFLSPTNFGLKASSRIGSGLVDKTIIDDSVLFVDRSSTKLYQAVFNGGDFDYDSADRTTLVPEIGLPTITVVAAQRQPDTRIHCVRSDGTAAVLVSEPLEDVSAWVEVETDGVIEDVVVLPGTTEDKVYYSVKRTINGTTKRYLEKWAQEEEAQGGTLNKQLDSFLTFSQSSSTTVSGLTHLEAKTVHVWGRGAAIATKTVSDGKITGLTGNTFQTVVVRNAANDADYAIRTISGAGTIRNLRGIDGSSVEVRAMGKYLDSYTVSSGAITVSEAVTEGVVGLTYEAPYKSVKLAYAADDGGTALNQTKRINSLSFVLKNTHYQGLQYGSDFDNLDDLPLVERGETTVNHTVWGDYDFDAVEFNGEYSTDSRMCLLAQAPKPCTILSAAIGIQTNEKR